MSIKNDSTVDGLHIVYALPANSKKIVTRICDNCGEEKEVQWNDIVRCRKKHATVNDYCFSCSMKVYNTGDNNPAKRQDVKDKISLTTRGKSKSFKDAKNPRIVQRRITTSGHALVWVDQEQKHVQEHRVIFAESIGKHHSELDEIHHINGDKLDNSLPNLIELTGSKHGILHSQLETLAFELVKNGTILFDKNSLQYVKSPALQQAIMERSFGFDDIAIKQKKNICLSRLDANIESEVIRGIKLQIPLIASNMSTVTNVDFCAKIAKLGAIGIFHRAAPKDQILNDITVLSKQTEWVAASIGIEQDQFDFSKEMIKNGCNILVIDIAHGYSDAVLQLAKKLKLFNSFIKIVVGNTTNVDMLYECYDFVDAIKVGIAQGLACETKNTAGCTEKQFSAVLKFKHASRKFGIPIISDGGIREPADFTKAIAAGASSVMAGSIFAATPESAAETIIVDGKTKKIYAGMASQYVQDKWKGGLKAGTCAEGGIRYLDIGLPLAQLLERYAGALRSGITYAGAKDIESFQRNAEFVLLK